MVDFGWNCGGFVVDFGWNCGGVVEEFVSSFNWVLGKLWRSYGDVVEGLVVSL